MTDEELESIKSDYKKRIHYKETEKRLNLNRTVTQETQKEVEELLAQRAQEALKKKIASQVSALPEQKINEIAAYFDCDKSEVADSINYLGVDTEYLAGYLNTGVHSLGTTMFGKKWLNITMTPIWSL